MYEQFGVAGLIAFQKTVAYCKEKGLVVIGDVNAAISVPLLRLMLVAHLGKVVVGEKSYAPFDEDFATVNPYLGSDGINPFIKVCKEENKGIFVLVKTSNPAVVSSRIVWWTADRCMKSSVKRLPNGAASAWQRI